jgi:hypothetical protein
MLGEERAGSPVEAGRKVSKLSWGSQDLTWVRRGLPDKEEIDEYLPNEDPIGY